MNELTDAELSLAVVKIVRSEYKWEIDKYSQVVTSRGQPLFFFKHTADDALGQMCIWYSTSILTYDEAMEFTEMLMGDNPHREIAEAVVDIGDR